MQLLRESLVLLIIVGVGVNGEERFGRNLKRMRHLKHLRSLGRHKFNHDGHVPPQREDDPDKRHILQSKRDNLSRHSDEIDLAHLESSTNIIKGFPELSILSNSEVVYDTSFKLNENSKASDDFSDDYDERNYNHLDEHHHKTRYPRSVSTKVKGPLLRSSLRKLSPPGRDPVNEESVTKEEPTESDQSQFEEILSASPNISTSGSSSASSGPSTSISESIPTNSGVTKIEINLSFGCLFFCE